MIEDIGIVVAEQFVEPVVAGGEGLMRRCIRRLRHLFGDPDEFFLGVQQFVEGRAGFFEERPAGRKLGMLFEEHRLGAGMQADVAGIGRVLPGEDSHQRGLARAVGPDEADALAVEQLEAQVLEERPAIERSRQPAQLINSMMLPYENRLRRVGLASVRQGFASPTSRLRKPDVTLARPISHRNAT